MLLPLQGVLLILMLTQGDALGLVLLGFQPDLSAVTWAFSLGLVLLGF